VLYNTEAIHGTTFTYTAMFVASASGTVVAGFFVSALSLRIGVMHTMVCAVWLWALSMIGLAAATGPVVAISMYFLLGAGTGLWLALNTTVRQKVTPRRLLGRMNAAYRTVSWGVVPFGAAFGGLAGRLFGLRTPFIVASVVLTATALFAPRILGPVAEAMNAAPDQQ
jgi:MFS family permease